MARIDYFDMSKASPPFAELMKSRRPLNIYRMLAHAGKPGEGFLALGHALLFDGALDPKLREIAILRVGQLSGAGYEIHQHTRIGRKAGLSDAKMAALVVGADAAALDDRERLVVRFTDEVVAKVKASDALFNEVTAQFDHQQVAELLLVIGYYMLVSRFLENLEVDIETP